MNTTSQHVAFDVDRTSRELVRLRKRKRQLLRTCCCPSMAMEDLARRAATTGRAKPQRAREVPRRPARGMANQARTAEGSD